MVTFPRTTIYECKFPARNWDVVGSDYPSRSYHSVLVRLSVKPYYVPIYTRALQNFRRPRVHKERICLHFIFRGICQTLHSGSVFLKVTQQFSGVEPVCVGQWQQNKACTSPCHCHYQFGRITHVRLCVSFIPHKSPNHHTSYPQSALMVRQVCLCPCILLIKLTLLI